MPRARLEALQEELLLEMLPHAYEHAAAHPPGVGRRGRAPARHQRRSRTSASVHRSSTRTRSAASATNAAIRTAGCARVPSAELTAVMSTSGTTGDPTLVPEKWGGGSGRPVDHHARLLGDGRAARRSHRARAVHLPRTDLRVVPGRSARSPILFDFDPAEMERFCELSLRVPADRPLQLRLGAHQRGARGVRTARLRPARCVRVVQGRRVRGRAAEPARACARRESWGVELFEHTRRRRRHRRVRVSRTRRPARLGGHGARRGPRSRRHRRSRRR